jgi:hypothetical protein
MTFLKLLVLRGSLGIALPSFLGAGVFHWASFGQVLPTITQQTRWGEYQATVSYQKFDDLPRYRNLKLKVSQGDRILYDRAIDREDQDDRLALDQSADAFSLQDLDGDNRPEVVLDIYTGGAHCCTYSMIYPGTLVTNAPSNAPSNAQAKPVTHQDWGNGAYQVADLNRDGKPEFYGQDDRFAYAFSSYAASGYPLKVWRYDGGKLQDDTRNYPAQIQESADKNWQNYLAAARKNREVRGVLAAYLADQYSLGQADAGWAKLKSVYQEPDRAVFFQRLQQFLDKQGYGKAPTSTERRLPDHCLTCRVDPQA